MSSQIMPSDVELRSNRADEVLALEEDTRLRNDIRLLGRILGDTVRDQEGADAVACARGRLQRGRAAPLFRNGAGQSGSDRAPHRSSPQEHDRPGDGDRDAAEPARTGPAYT